MKYSLQSYRALYNRIFRMCNVLHSIPEKRRTEGETLALKSLEFLLDEYERKIKVLGWENDSFLKVV